MNTSSNFSTMTVFEFVFQGRGDGATAVRPQGSGEWYEFLGYASERAYLTKGSMSYDEYVWLDADDVVEVQGVEETPSGDSEEYETVSDVDCTMTAFDYLEDWADRGHEVRLQGDIEWFDSMIMVADKVFLVKWMPRKRSHMVEIDMFDTVELRK